MKTWINLTCLTCGFRHQPRRFLNALEPVHYPAQIVTGGGRAKGFHIERYVSWPELTILRKEPEVWRALNCEYIRLSSAYDNFHHYLGFLSPSMSEVIDSLNQEIFRLRALCRELRDQCDRLLLAQPHRGVSNEFRRILEEVNRREEESRRSTRDIHK